MERNTQSRTKNAKCYDKKEKFANAMEWKFTIQTEKRERNTHTNDMPGDAFSALRPREKTLFIEIDVWKISIFFPSFVTQSHKSNGNERWLFHLLPPFFFFFYSIP